MAIENDELKRVVGGKVAGVQEEVIERALRTRVASVGAHVKYPG